MKIPAEVFESVASEMNTDVIENAEADALADLFIKAGPHTIEVGKAVCAMTALRYPQGLESLQASALNIFLFGVHVGALCRDRIEESAKLERML